MTSEPANLLIAGLCLLSVVLAGGFTQTLVSQHSDVQFKLQSGSSIDCPPDRVIRPCADYNITGNNWRVQLLEPFLEGLLVVNSTSSSTETPTPGTPGTATSSPGESTGTTVREPTAASTQTAEAPPTQAGGFAPGVGFEWLLWPALATLGALILGGVALGLRRSAVESPRDLLNVIVFVPNTLVSLLIRLTTSVADWLGREWARIQTWFGALSRPTSAAHMRSVTDWRAIIRGLLFGIAALPSALLDRLRKKPTAGHSRESPSHPHRPLAEPPEPEDGEFDIRAAWRWLAHRTGGPMGTGRTPHDIARAAIDGGLPRSAVTDLLDAFRDVTYGERAPTGDRLRHAREAYETLRAADRPSSEGGE